MDAPRAGLIAGCVAVFYCYGGCQNALNLAADVRGARKSLPLGICAGMLAVTAAYLILNAAYVHVLGLPGVERATLVAADLARACFGRSGEGVVSVAIFLSAAGFVNATILQLPRSYLAMAQDGLLPAAFGRVNRETQVQGVGLAFVAATMLIPAFFLGSFETLLNYVIFTDSLMLAIVVSTVFVLRRRQSRDGEAQPFRVPLYPVLPLLFIGCLLAIGGYVAVSRPGLALAGTGILVAGCPVPAAAASALVRRPGTGAQPRSWPCMQADGPPSASFSPRPLAAAKVRGLAASEMISPGGFHAANTPRLPHRRVRCRHRRARLAGPGGGARPPLGRVSQPSS
jgi:amino acid transporter